MPKLDKLRIDGTDYDVGGTLEQATESTLGGIKASPKTDNETAEVKIDNTTGKLYSKIGTTDERVEQIITSKGYITSSALNGYAKSKDIPTNNNQLENGAGYLKEIPSEYVTDSELIGKGYQTSSQVNTLIDNKKLIPLSQKGVNNGVATLDSNGKIVSSQLPSGIDEIKEYANKDSFPKTGDGTIIYVALDTNKTYRWSGTEYTVIGSDLALGETSSTAYAGNKGKANAEEIAKLKTDVAGKTTEARVNEIINGKGFQTKSQVDSNITGRGYQTASQVNSIVDGKGYTKVEPTTSASGTEIKGIKIDNVPYKFPAGGSGGGGIDVSTPYATGTITSETETTGIAYFDKILPSNNLYLLNILDSSQSIVMGTGLLLNNKSLSFALVTISNGDNKTIVTFDFNETSEINVSFGDLFIKDIEGSLVEVYKLS